MFIKFYYTGNCSVYLYKIIIIYKFYLITTPKKRARAAA